MASRLYSEHRWCVSGTPVGRGKLDDLYGLLLFLDIPLYSERSWWTHSILEPLKSHSREASSEDEGTPLLPKDQNIAWNTQRAAERLLACLQLCMWRSSKSRVSDQLGLPVQTTVVRTLKHSTIERVFYDKQKERSKADGSTALAKLKKRFRLDAKSANPPPAFLSEMVESLNGPLLTLRQVHRFLILQND